MRLGARTYVGESAFEAVSASFRKNKRTCRESRWLLRFVRCVCMARAICRCVDNMLLLRKHRLRTQGAGVDKCPLCRGQGQPASVVHPVYIPLVNTCIV